MSLLSTKRKMQQLCYNKKEQRPFDPWRKEEKRASKREQAKDFFFFFKGESSGRREIGEGD